MPTVAVEANAAGAVDILELIVSQGMAKSRNEARRLIQQGGVKHNDAVLKQPTLPQPQAPGVLKVGSSPARFLRLVLPGGAGPH